MVERLAAAHPLHDAVLLPEPFEERRALDEVGDERFDPRLRLSSPIANSERRDEAGPAPPAGAEEVVDFRIEEDEARHVPLGRRSSLKTGEKRRCGRIPSEQVEPRTDDEGRQRLDGGEQAEQSRANIVECVGVVRRGGTAGEGEEMSSLDDVEKEGAGERVEHGVGGADPAALEPLDVVDAHRGERGDLFAPQSLDPAAAAGVEADVLGLDARAPGSEEFTELVAHAAIVAGRRPAYPGLICPRLAGIGGGLPATCYL